MNDSTLETAPDFSPFVGLTPFDEAHAEYFFGREKDIQVVATNLRASRVTILYGGSGVGKSSVIRAGVVPFLRERSQLTAIPGEPPDFLCVIIREWVNDPILSMRVGIEEAVKCACDRESMTNLSRAEFEESVAKFAEKTDIESLLIHWTKVTKSKFLFIFDQFEDIFAKKNVQFLSGPGSFGEGFPAAIGNEKVTSNFLISMRDDSLSKLDCFRGRLPLNNLLRLRHLNRELTELAIRGPVTKYNQKTGSNFIVDDDLVTEVIDEVRVGNIKLDTQGKAKEELDPALEVRAEEYGAETPYLQLVLARLWGHPLTQRTKHLSLDTLVGPTSETKLGGVENIVKTHLDEVMSKLSAADQELASEFIHFTVTRSGTKIPSEAAGLADWAELPDRVADIERILETLSSGKTRVFKTVTSLDDKNENQRYEVAHDALAPAVLSWRTRYIEREQLALLEKQEFTISKQESTILRITRVILPIGIGAVILVFAIGSRYGYDWAYNWGAKDKSKELENQEQAEVQLQLRSRERDLGSLLSIFGSLARGTALSASEREDKIKELADLVKDGKLTDEDKASFSALAPKIMDKPTSNQVVELLGKKEEAVQLRRVFLQYLDPRQKDAEHILKGILTDAQFTVPKSQTFDGINLSSSQVRYFYEGDADLAGTVAGLFQAWGIPGIRAKLVPGYSEKGLPHGQLEVWFAPNALAVPGVVTGDDFALYLNPGNKSSVLNDVKVGPGAAIERQLCKPQRETFGGKTGRWCRVYCAGQYGWALDAWFDDGAAKE